MKQKIKKSRPPRNSFAERLFWKIKEAQIGNTSSGTLSDGSGSWVSLKIGKKTLNFSFDPKCEKITRIGVWKDIIEVTDTKQIF